MFHRSAARVIEVYPAFLFIALGSSESESDSGCTLALALGLDGEGDEGLALLRPDVDALFALQSQAAARVMSRIEPSERRETTSWE